MAFFSIRPNFLHPPNDSFLTYEMPSLRATPFKEDYFWYAIFPELVFCFLLAAMFLVWTWLNRKNANDKGMARIIVMTPHLQHIQPESLRVHIEYTPVLRGKRKNAADTADAADATAAVDTGTSTSVDEQTQNGSPMPALLLGSPAIASTPDSPTIVIDGDIAATGSIAEDKKNI